MARWTPDAPLQLPDADRSRSSAALPPHGSTPLVVRVAAVDPAWCRGTGGRRVPLSRRGCLRVARRDGWLLRRLGGPRGRSPAGGSASRRTAASPDGRAAASTERPVGRAGPGDGRSARRPPRGLPSLIMGAKMGAALRLRPNLLRGPVPARRSRSRARVVAPLSGALLVGAADKRNARQCPEAGQSGRDRRQPEEHQSAQELRRAPHQHGAPAAGVGEDRRVQVGDRRGRLRCRAVSRSNQAFGGHHAEQRSNAG